MTVRAPKTDLGLVKKSPKLRAFRWAYRASLAVNCLRLVGDFALAGCSLLASHDRDAFFDRMSDSMRHRLNPLNGTYTRALDILQKTQRLTDPEILTLSKGFRPVLVPYEKIYNEKIVPAVNKVLGDGRRVCAREIAALTRELLAREPLCDDGAMQFRACIIPPIRPGGPPVYLRQNLCAGQERSLSVFQCKEEGAELGLWIDGGKTEMTKDCWVLAVKQEAAIRSGAKVLVAPSYGAPVAAPA